MKIIEVAPRFSPHTGGIETHVLHLSKLLIESGFDVEVFTTNPAARTILRDSVDGIPVTRFPSIAPYDTGYYSHGISKALQKAKTDLVHAHGYQSLPMLSAALAKRHNKSRLVVTTHLGVSKLGRLPYLLYDPVFGRMIFDEADKILLVSRQELDMLPILGRYSGKVEVIPNGIEISDESFDEVFERKRKDPFKLLYVGRLEKRKGVDTAINVLAHLPEKTMELHIVGVGGYANHLSEISQRLGLADRVCFHGTLKSDDLRRLYLESHILLLLSEWESFGISIIEAMSAGVVPIATRVGGIPSVIGENAGCLVDYPVDEKGVAEVVRQLYAEPRILRDLASKGWIKAREDYDMRRLYSRIAGVYHGI